jgi:prolipoprotein diacylglyceryltransferase
MLPYTTVEPRPSLAHFHPMKESTDRKLGPWGWFAILVLAGFLIGSIAYAVHAWNALSDVGISTMGWVFLVCGVVFTTLVGGGLMALLFYSSRHHYDQ